MLENFIVDICSPYALVFILGSFLSMYISKLLSGFNDMKLDKKERLAEFMNLHPLISKLYAKDKLEEKERYVQTTSFLSWTESSCNDPAKFLFFIFGGYAITMWSMMKAFPSLPIPIQISLAVIASSLIFGNALFLGFEILSEKIEKLFGYSTMTTKTFITDHVKNLVISSITILATISGAFYLLKSLGHLDFASGTIFVLIVFAYEWLLDLASWYIFMPLFNKFTILGPGNLRDKLSEMISKYGYKLGDIRVVDESKRSNKGNAFCMNIPFGPKKIVIFDTLLKQLSEDEIVAVFAHELGHEKLKHNLVQFLFSFFLTAAFIYAAIFFIYKPELYHAFGFRWVTETNVQDWSLVGLGLLSLLKESVLWVIVPIEAFLSRKMEYAADRYAVKVLKTGESLITGLIKLYFEAGGDVIPNKIAYSWDASHPMLVNRIKALRNEEEKVKNV